MPQTSMTNLKVALRLGHRIGPHQQCVWALLPLAWVYAEDRNVVLLTTWSSAELLSLNYDLGQSDRSKCRHIYDFSSAVCTTYDLFVCSAFES